MSSRVIRVAAVGLLVADLALILPGTAAGQESCPDGETRPTTDPVGSNIRGTVECPEPPPDPDPPELPAQPIAAPGGGRGEDSTCIWEPYGPISEVRKLWDAVNRREKPEINDPGDPERSYFVGPWYRVTPDYIELRYLVTCVKPPDSRDVWVPVTPTDDGGFVPQITPEDLIPDLFDRVSRQLPTPIPRIAPADLLADGFAFVQAETFFWVDQAPGQWEDVSATASVPGLSLTITAAPTELVVSPGDGETVQCLGIPPAFPTGANPDTFQGCEYVYPHSSAMAPNGQTYPVTVAIVWHATWQASNGESGDLGVLTTTSPVRELPVAESQAVLVDG